MADIDYFCIKTSGTFQDAATPPDFLASLFSEEVSEKAPDILGKMLPDQWAELEAKARAQVIAENRDPIRALAQKGKAFERVRAMMRRILRERA